MLSPHKLEECERSSQAMSSTPTSHKSSQTENNAPPTRHERKGFRKGASELQNSTTSRDVLVFLIAFRILNALSVKTFFQPDEYFQSLEPAWEMVFGVDSGAWMTWVSFRILHILGSVDE